MGYDTSLSVGDSILLMWRKHASHLPRLLFRHDQVVIEDLPIVVDDEGVETGGITVQYRTTAADALATLEEAGVGWNATVAAYADTRVHGTSVGMLWAQQHFSKADAATQERMIEEFKRLPPEVDLDALGATLASLWADSEAEDLPLFEEISYDGQIESPTMTSMPIYDRAANLDGVNPFAAVRATESWSVLYREAPLLAWPMLVCVLLRHLEPSVNVVLDLTDDAAEYDYGSSVADAAEYATDYWTWTTEALASSARTMSRLFSVLASFDSKLAPEFWFARAAGLYGQLKDLASVKESTTTKARGDALELLVDALLRTEEPQLQVIERNFRTREEEIDVLLSNGLADPFWIAQSSPLILIECKNKDEKASVVDLRVFESKIDDRGAVCKIGIFVSMSGFAKTFLDRLKTFQGEKGIIFALSGDDLKQLIDTKTRITDWLRGPGLLRAMGKS
ncbi:restriction endonuclease [Modestobacter sp. VKM Ac-2984]|uniref:restriction endonuclease n=1 Tax=Modestobacter sp. VKM Ac-2984 TaxID=3004138 RepID=UPI0022AA3655|nr:restriction endonuclease [Modestobacter sp. VKM Ac-2984]MCZ2814914.1 restriction endonuclease [Modestobacter sp. VKM Ac-2984]